MHTLLFELRQFGDIVILAIAIGVLIYTIIEGSK